MIYVVTVTCKLECICPCHTQTILKRHSLTQGGITRGARCSTSYHFYLNCFSRNVRGSANNVVSAQFASVEALQ